MKTGILTVHQSVNCGASLQAAALYSVLSDMAANPEIIDYRPEYFVGETDGYWKKKGIKSAIKRSLFNKRLSLTQDKFDEFIKQYMPNITNRVNTPEELKSAKFDYEAIVCGSDQIWNPPHVQFDESWFLNFADNKTRRVSYAASIGKDVLTDEELHWIKAGISAMDCVGVRELAAKQLIENLGFEARLCLDPTLLLPADRWKSMEKAPNDELPREYIFYYPLNSNPEIEEKMLGLLKKRTGLPVVAMSDGLRWLKHADMVLRGFGPDEFLYLMNHSSFVYTNSFHGLAFSIIFDKDLVSFKNKTKNSRLESLCKISGLKNYQVLDARELESKDWDDRFQLMRGAYGRLSQIRESSLEYLYRSLCIKPRG